MNRLETYAIGSSELTYDPIERILNDNTKLVLSDEARAKITKCREFLDRKTDENTVAHLRRNDRLRLTLQQAYLA